jgi:hypothetical protein
MRRIASPIAPQVVGVVLVRRRDDADAERLRQDQHVARFRRPRSRRCGRDALADDGESVDRLVGLDRVAAHDVDPRLLRLERAAAQDLGEHVGRQRRVGKADDAERRQRHAAHRVHVGQRVRRGDRAEVERVVDDRREEVRREHERAIGARRITAASSAVFEPTSTRGSVTGGRSVSNGQQIAGRMLRRAARALRGLREAHSARRPASAWSRSCASLADRARDGRLRA